MVTIHLGRRNCTVTESLLLATLPALQPQVPQDSGPQRPALASQYLTIIHLWIKKILILRKD